MPVRFNLAGVKPGEKPRTYASCMEGQAAQTKLKAARGPQRALLACGHCTIPPGIIKLSRRARRERSGPRVRLVESSVGGSTKRQVHHGDTEGTEKQRYIVCNVPPLISVISVD